MRVVQCEKKNPRQVMSGIFEVYKRFFHKSLSGFIIEGSAGQFSDRLK